MKLSSCSPLRLFCASLRHYVAKIGLKIAQHVSCTTKRKAKQSKGKDKTKNKSKSSDNQRCRRRRFPLLLAKYLANK